MRRSVLTAVLVCLLAVNVFLPALPAWSAPGTENALPLPVQGKPTGDMPGSGAGAVYLASSGDLVQYNGDVNVKAGETVTGNVVAMNGDVVVGGKVMGNITAVSGDVILRSTAFVAGNVTAVRGKVIREPGARVLGREESNVRLEHAYPFYSGNEVPGHGSVPVIISFWRWLLYLLGLAALTAVAAALFPGRLAAMTAGLQAEPGRLLGTGLLGWIILPVALLALAITLVGIPVAVLVVLTLPLVVLTGAVLLGLIIGRQVERALEKRWPRLGGQTLLVQAVTGVALIWLAQSAPLAGFLIWPVAAVAGMGALLATRFGTNRPWWNDRRRHGDDGPGPLPPGGGDGGIQAPGSGDAGPRNGNNAGSYTPVENSIPVDNGQDAAGTAGTSLKTAAGEEPAVHFAAHGATGLPPEERSGEKSGVKPPAITGEETVPQLNGRQNDPPPAKEQGALLPDWKNGRGKLPGIVVVALLLGSSLLFGAAPARAQGLFQIGSGINVPAGQNVDGAVSIGGPVNVDGNVRDGVVAVGGPARISGRVGDGVVVLGGPLTVSGATGQGLVAIGGPVDLSGTAGKGLVIVGGVAHLAPSARVDGDLVVIGGRVDRAPGATVSGQVISISSGEFISREITRWFSGYPWPGMTTAIFWWRWVSLVLTLILLLLINVLFPAFSAKVAGEVSLRPGRSLLWGLVIMILAPPVTFLMVVTVLGIPLAGLLWVALAGLYFLGLAGLAEALGSRILRAAGAAEPATHLATLAGVLVLGLVAWIPFAGMVAGLLLKAAGLGAASTVLWSGRQKVR
ncbi:bactofilin family protein [Desulfotomaculum copahuensis]|uniref:DUF8173 domain-containing protein n=1 Tax=Desulfotomaculum copahuensis TaxID=1838280 RepID=A0A1B7LCV2_9FIRM|nr:polymer-forming cytoskeletal protein [Desulfotomaculum copahuensis]OAT80747.1 hypothetical protein A6M21_12930 [Desulfotomaculum copahuensis]